MQDSKEIKRLWKFARKIVKKETYKKIKKLKTEELSHTLKYSIISAFKYEYHLLLYEVKNLEKSNKDLFFLKNKLILIPSKIKHFEVDYNEADFYKLSNLIKEIKKEMAEF